MQVHCDEGVAIHIGPEFMRRCPRGPRRSVDRGTHRPAIEPRKFPIPGADAVRFCGRQHVPTRHCERRDDPAWSETLACADAPCAGTGRSRDRPFGSSRRSASGRRGAVADDARSREVRLCHSSWEADEQSGPDRSGAGGAKGGGQGEREPAKHAPDTVPGNACHRRWSAYGKSRRHTPKVGAVCANSARTDLCGGRSAMTVPTALCSEHYRF